jgi:hypothetical protein
MRRNWFVVLIAGLLTCTLLACSEGEVTKEAALEIARKAFAADNDQIREFEIWESDSSDEYWQFSAKGTGEYARPGYHGFVQVDKKTGQATTIMGE